MNYKAFISYRHTENGRRHAVALETALKRYAKPTLARPMKIFRDEKHFKPDISLPKLIRDGLENSEYLIFLAEKASAESPWCGQELEQWCNPEKLNRTQNLIIVLIDNDFATNDTHDGIDWEKTDALPALLRPYLTSIPLYVDLRWAENATDTDLQHPKYRHEINALAARLRGVNPEDLNDEEIRVFRRNIRLRNGVIGVLGFLLLTTVLALFAVRRLLLATEKEARVAQNSARALLLEKTNPTAAFRIADYNLNAHPESQVALMTYNLLLEKISDNPFFRTEYRCRSDILCVAISPDGQYVLTGCEDGTAILWNIVGQKIRTFSGHTDKVLSVDFSPDGNFILTSSLNEAKLWNVEGKEIKTLYPNKDENFFSATFSADGKYILTSPLFSGIVTLWSIDGKKVKIFCNDCDGVFSPDGKYVLTACGKEGAILWGIDGKKNQIYGDKTTYILSVAFSADGKYVLTGRSDSTAVLWYLDGREIRSYSGHDGEVGSVAFCPDGEHILTGSDDSTVIFWNIDGRKIRKFKNHNDRIREIAISEDGKYALTCDGDRTAQLWDINTKDIKKISLPDGSLTQFEPVAFTPDGKYIETKDYGDTVSVWSLDGRKIRAYRGRIDTISSIVISNNRGYRLEGVYSNGVMEKILIITPNGQVIWTFLPLAGWESFGFCSFSPDGKYLLMLSYDASELYLCPAPWTFLEEHMEKLTPQQLRAFGAQLEPGDY